MIRIPPIDTKKWTQPNDSDIHGELYISNNLDTDEVDGKIRLGKRLVVNTNTKDVSSLIGCPIGFRSINQTFFTVAGVNGTGYVFKSGSADLTSPFIKETASGSPTSCDSLYSDIEVLQGNLFVTTPSTTAYYSSSAVYAGGGTGTWYNFTVPYAAGFTMPMCAYAGRVYMAYGGNKIISWDNAANGATPPNVASLGSQYTLDISALGGIITFIRAASNKIWIGTVNQNGTKGYVYSWDGSSNQVTSSYRLQSPGALSCVIKDDVPCIMDAYGILSSWTGGTFKEIATLNMENNRLLFNPLGVSNQRFIHPNGMAIIYGNVSLLIDGRNNDGTVGSPDTNTQLKTIPSGLWQYSDDNGLVHRGSFGLTHSGDSIIDYGQLRFPYSNTNYSTVGGISEILAGSVTSNGSFLAGGAVTNDINESNPPTLGTNFGIYYDDLNDTLPKAGVIVTPKFQSQNVTDIYQNLFMVHKKLINSTDKFVTKYRIVDAPTVGTPANYDYTEVAATAISNNTITVAYNGGQLSDMLAGPNGGPGDEVSIVQGYGAGMSAHITSIVSNGTIYTVVLDETIPFNVSVGIRVRFQKWTKMKESTSQFLAVKQCAINCPPATYIQFKIWLFWSGKNEVETLIVQNVPSQVANFKP